MLSYDRNPFRILIRLIIYLSMQFGVYLFYNFIHIVHVFFIINSVE